MQITAVEIDKVLTLLAETLRRMTLMLSDFDNARLQRRPAKDTWSVNDILAHLRACSDVWGEGIATMIQQQKPAVRYVSPRAYMRKTDYPQQEFHHSFQAFAAQRNQLLQLLHGLEIEEWSRSAIVLRKASERKETVFSYAQRIAQHEMQHLEQIESMLHEISD